MKQISNRHYDLLMEKLPRVLRMAREGGGAATLRQQEDIRLLALMCRQLEKKNFTK